MVHSTRFRMRVPDAARGNASAEASATPRRVPRNGTGLAARPDVGRLGLGGLISQESVEVNATCIWTSSSTQGGAGRLPNSSASPCAPFVTHETYPKSKSPSTRVCLSTHMGASNGGRRQADGTRTPESTHCCAFWRCLGWNPRGCRGNRRSTELEAERRKVRPRSV